MFLNLRGFEFRGTPLKDLRTDWLDTVKGHWQGRSAISASAKQQVKGLQAPPSMRAIPKLAKVLKRSRPVVHEYEGPVTTSFRPRYNYLDDCRLRRITISSLRVHDSPSSDDSSECHLNESGVIYDNTHRSGLAASVILSKGTSPLNSRAMNVRTVCLMTRSTSSSRLVGASGGSHLDLSRFSVANADVDLSGGSEATLNLSGSLTLF